MTPDFAWDPQRDAWWNDETIILGEDMPPELETPIMEWMPPRKALDLGVGLRLSGGPRE
jgi:hypothetical protein